MVLTKAPAILRKLIRYDKMIYDLLSPHLNGGDVLSVGCGEGKAEYMLKKRGIRIEGVEVTKYNTTQIPVLLYDGKTLPVKDKLFDTTLFVYVLHHSTDMEKLLREAIRVTKKEIIILDHVYDNGISKSMLKAYDYGANIFYGMPIPLNFLKVKEWKQMFKKLNLTVEEFGVPSPLNVFFKLKI